MFSKDFYLRVVKNQGLFGTGLNGKSLYISNFIQSFEMSAKDNPNCLSVSLKKKKKYLSLHITCMLTKYIDILQLCFSYLNTNLHLNW